MTVGPNAVLGFSREGYAKGSFHPGDIADMSFFAGFWKMAMKNWRSAISEFGNSTSRARYLKQCRKYCPSLELSDLGAPGAGIRAQAVLAFFFVGDAAVPSELVHSRYWLGLMVAVSLVGVLVGLLILVVATADVVNELQRERDSDPLTGLLNRRGLERQADLRLHTPQCLSYGVIIADIDHFKAINDAYGHPVGDQVLVEFARILSSASKDHAIVGRVGGEEFVLLVSGTAEECEALGNRLCGLVARHAFSKLPAGQKVTSRHCGKRPLVPTWP